MRYLVTGGCGFIGTHLCQDLKARGDQVIVLDNMSSGQEERLPAGCDLIVGDVRDPDAVGDAMRGVDGVFHLAAIASVEKCNVDWRGGHLTNQSGAVTIFEKARDFGKVPVVYTSSAAIYGDATSSPLEESHCAAPQTAYGADKYGCELHARVAQQIHGVRTVGLRPFNVYGPGQNPNSSYSGVISIFADRMQKQEPFCIFGDGEQTRDFVFVRDAVRFFLAAMKLRNRAPEVFNIATGRATSLLKLITTLEHVLGRRAEFTHLPARPGDVRHSCGVPLKAMRWMGVTTKTSLKLGLWETYERGKARRPLHRSTGLAGPPRLPTGRPSLADQTSEQAAKHKEGVDIRTSEGLT